MRLPSGNGPKPELNAEGNIRFGKGKTMESTMNNKELALKMTRFARMERLDKKASDTWAALRKARDQWEVMKETLQAMTSETHSSAWREYCELKGFSPEATFEDIGA